MKRALTSYIPRTRLVSTQIRHNRNWRFHKEVRLWLTKESGTAPSQKASTYERGVYTFFDPESWERVKKETVIMYDLLEEKAPLPISSVGGGVITGGGAGTPQGMPSQQQQQQPPMPPPGMGMLGQVQQSHGQPSQQAQQQMHQQQLAEQQMRMQGMNARYQGTRTPGLGAM